MYKGNVIQKLPIQIKFYNIELILKHITTFLKKIFLPQIRNRSSLSNIYINIKKDV